MSISRRLFLFSLGFSLVSCGTKAQQIKANDLQSLNWEQIITKAKGTTVNWAMWSGSNNINKFVDQWVAQQLKDNYQITLNRVPLSDTVEAVNKVVGEFQAGLTAGGSIDLIWINGENFRTLKQGNFLFGPFSQKLPSMQFYDLNNPAVTADFGLPIENFSAPYTGSYYLMAADAAKAGQLPSNFTELLAWAKANPGRFTYVAPPAFDGSRFLLSAFYGTTGGYQKYSGPEFQPNLWNQNSPKLVAYLQELAPYLWRQTYPPTQQRLGELFANGEIWLMPAFVSQIAEGIATRRFPPTTKGLALAGAALNDPSFTAIPKNATNPWGAMVLADLLASPAGQLQKFDPQVWGDPPLLSGAKLDGQTQQKFAAAESRYGLPLRELIRDTVPVVNAEYTTQLEKLWQQRLAGK